MASALRVAEQMAEGLAHAHSRGVPKEPVSPGTSPALTRVPRPVAKAIDEVEKARARNDELLRRWARADPDAPLLVEAKALQARLAGAR